MRIHVSKGNGKMGKVPNISFPPVITCRKGVPCATDGCYAIKFYKMYASCRKAWEENLDLWNEDHNEFFEELGKSIGSSKYARFFVSGDIPEDTFVDYMFNFIWEHPHTEFLCFTKQYEYVNHYIKYMTDWCGLGLTDIIPPNLHLIFSTWEGFEPDNPYNFPTSAVITPDMETIPDNWKICGGNCQDCICRGIGCWELKQGEVIAFHKH